MFCEELVGQQFYAHAGGEGLALAEVTRAEEKDCEGARKQPRRANIELEYVQEEQYIEVEYPIWWPMSY